MQKSKISEYIESFFSELTISYGEDGMSKREYLAQSILAFLNDETKETAFDVYKVFFGTYRIVLKGSKNPFVDLLDMLCVYEERAATLIEKQRDHFIHSVNVFILGLAIYARNSRYRDAFTTTVMDEARYPENFSTAKEEFLFRWGIAALFHDVGYPVEIIGKQIGTFLKFATDADHDDKLGSVKAHLEFENFRRLNSVAEVIPKKEFIRSFYEQNANSVYIDLLQPIDLLAQKISDALGIPILGIKQKLDLYLSEMATSGFIDHGYYSAIIVLKWYGYLIQTTGENPLRFYHSIVDSACAILLHNYYNMTLIKEFKLAPLNAEQYPIAYLLMFCDEMQDWNRAALGTKEKYRTQISSANIAIEDEHFAISYYTLRGIIPCKFVDDKNRLFERILNIRGVFSKGLEIDCITLEDIFVEAQQDASIPRPLLENMELLARAIHEDYIATQKRRNAQTYVAEDFDQLEPSTRYSNLRQAMNIDRKLRILGYAMVPFTEQGDAMDSLDREAVERYAILEHEDWMHGKERFGWTYAPVRNDLFKQHDCLVPWSELPDNQKQKDIDTAKNIIKLATIAGMKIVRISSNG